MALDAHNRLVHDTATANKHVMTGLQQCTDRCTSTDDCRLFTWDLRLGACYVYHSGPGTETLSSFLKHTPDGWLRLACQSVDTLSVHADGHRQIKVQQDTQIAPGCNNTFLSTGLYSNTSEQACFKTCREIPGCAALSYETATATCTLYIVEEEVRVVHE